MKASVVSGLMAVSLFLASQAHAANVGQEAPGCPMKDMQTNSPIDLAKYRGKVVYLDFWASWCGPCAQSMPFLNKMHSELKGQGLEVIGVNLDENVDDAQAFIKSHPVNFTLAKDDEGKCPHLFNVQAMPSSYIIDRQGKIHQIRLGFKSTEAKAARSEIEALLAKK